jgi:hypothetical protein
MYFEATDVLNYILEDIFYSRNITHIKLIYFSFLTDKFTAYYPGGATTYPFTSDYDP